MGADGQHKILKRTYDFHFFLQTICLRTSNPQAARKWTVVVLNPDKN